MKVSMYDDSSTSDKSEPGFLWSSADHDVTLERDTMEANKVKLVGWWKTVTPMVWEPYSRLLSKDAELQAHIATL